MGLLDKRNITLRQFRQLVKTSISKAQVIKGLNLNVAGATYRWFDTVVSHYEIDTSHFKGQGHLKNKSHNWTLRRSLDEILVSDSDYLNTDRLKKRLYREGLLTEQCSTCGQGPSWNGRILVLHLDHIDGDPRNNQLKNLRILCPNCHSQTKTYCRQK